MNIKTAIQKAAESVREILEIREVENPDKFPGEAVQVEGVVTVSEDLFDRQKGYRVRVGDRMVMLTFDLSRAAARAVALIVEATARKIVREEILERTA